MRTITFRGKRNDNGAWIYGSLEIIQGCGAQYAVIHTFSDWNLNIPYEVDINTVGQFTGLLDKSGKEIYDQDIIQYEDELFVIEWNQSGTCYWFSSLSDDLQSTFGNLTLGIAKESLVVSNSYDNK